MYAQYIFRRFVFQRIFSLLHLRFPNSRLTSNLCTCTVHGSTMQIPSRFRVSFFCDEMFAVFVLLRLYRWLTNSHKIFIEFRWRSDVTSTPETPTLKLLIDISNPELIETLHRAKKSVTFTFTLLSWRFHYFDLFGFYFVQSNKKIREKKDDTNFIVFVTALSVSEFFYQFHVIILNWRRKTE